MATIKLTRNKIALLGIMLIVLIAGVTGVMIWMKSHQPVEEDTPAAAVVPVDDVQVAALDYIHDNDIDGGLKYYDQQIDARKDKNEKQRLLLDKSNFALQSGRPQDALDAAKQADAIASDIGTIEIMARIYEVMGDKAQSLTLYKKLLELSGDNAQDSSMWKEKIKDLQR